MICPCFSTCPKSFSRSGFFFAKFTISEAEERLRFREVCFQRKMTKMAAREQHEAQRLSRFTANVKIVRILRKRSELK